MCINDGIAIGVYEAIKEKGLKIPEDISVIGHDNDKLGNKIEPTLTSIDPMYENVAEAIVSCFKRKLWNENDKVVVKGRVIMRNSLIENLKYRDE
jgi:DNA-binding LacI/PurR family transcriptional regulator